MLDNPDSIDFGDDLSSGDIDWGTLDTPVTEEPASIDWDITSEVIISVSYS